MTTFAFLASPSQIAQKALKALMQHYKTVDPQKADVIVVLGGDGFMLETLHAYKHHKGCFYGLNFGSVGFLLNNPSKENLEARIQKAEEHILYPLEMTVTDDKGIITKALCINEVSLLRQSRQAAHIEISVDGHVKLPLMIGDGVLVATPAGSTAYNLSVHGPILPLSANLMALTPISPFRPRRWRGAILPHTSVVELKILDPHKRPVSAVADFTEVSHVRHVRIEEHKNVHWRILFDAEHNLEDRILNEQFVF